VRRDDNAATVTGRGKARIAIANPLEHATEIKQFFLTQDRPDFAVFFDRTYPAAVKSGAMSWLGRDETGRLVMHQACFPRRFRFGQRDVSAGLLTNLLVAREYRSFFPALALTKQVVQDLEARRGIDFLYADPNEASRAVLQAARFARVGTLVRYVLPVADGRVLVDVGIRLFHALLRATGGAAARLDAVPQAAQGFSLESVAAPHPTSQHLTPYREPALYVSRMSGYPSDLDWWLTFRRPRTSGPADGALLIRGPDARGVAFLQAVRCAAGVGPAAMLPSLIAELRHRGCTRLQAVTVAESEFGRALRRAGFFARHDAVPLMALAITPLGAACVGSVRDWEITELDCDR
jgi:hypothetical protein